MARKPKVNSECTGHVVRLCPENKYIIDIEMANRKRSKAKASDSVSAVVNFIIEDWAKNRVV